MAEMKAALVLTLQDRLTAGLNSLRDKFDQLKRVGSGLGLGKLESGAEVLRGIAREAAGLVMGLGNVRAAASRAYAELKRMADPALKWGRETFGPEGRIGKHVGPLQAAAAGYSVLRPIREYADYSGGLLRSAQVTGKHGPEAVREMRRLDRMFGDDALHTGMRSNKIAEAYYGLLAGGVPAGILDHAIMEHTKFAAVHHVDPAELEQLSLALLNPELMALTPDQYRTALGQAAMTSRSGLIKIAGFSRHFPIVAGAAANLGMKGPETALQLMTAMQIVRNRVGEDGQAATDVRSLLEHVYAPVQERAMRMKGHAVPDDLRKMVRKNAGAWKTAFGIDYAGYMRAQEKAGVNPLDAYINLFRKVAKAPNFTDQSRIFYALAHGQQSATATAALVGGWDGWMARRAAGRTLGPDVLDRDMEDYQQSPAKKMGSFEEAAHQIGRRLGEGFLPVLIPINEGLGRLLERVHGLDDKLPGLGNAVLGVTGGMLVLLAVLGAIGFAAPAVIAGFGLMAQIATTLGIPLALGAAVALPFVAGAATVADVWNFKPPPDRSGFAPRVSREGDDVEDPVTRYERTRWRLSNALAGGLQNMGEGLDAIWKKAGDWLKNSDAIATSLERMKTGFEVMIQPVRDFFDVLNSWSGGALLDGLKALGDRLSQLLDPFRKAADAIRATATGAAAGGSWQAEYDINGNQIWRQAPAAKAEVTIKAEPGTAVTGTQAGPGVTIHGAPSAGPTLNRP